MICSVRVRVVVVVERTFCFLFVDVTFASGGLTELNELLRRLLLAFRRDLVDANILYDFFLIKSS